MELQVERIIDVEILLGRRLFHAIDYDAQFLQLFGPDYLRKSPPHQLVERGTDFVKHPWCFCVSICIIPLCMVLRASRLPLAAVRGARGGEG